MAINKTSTFLITPFSSNTPSKLFRGDDLKYGASYYQCKQSSTKGYLIDMRVRSSQLLWELYGDKQE